MQKYFIADPDSFHTIITVIDLNVLGYSFLFAEF